jgi:hypothetical protein
VTAEGLLLGAFLQAAVAVGLHIWGRWVAARQGGRWWRRASFAPLVAFGLGLVGVVVGVLFLHQAFTASGTSAAMKAELLARGISRAMTWSACFFLPSWLLYLGGVVTFIVGSVRRPRAG